MRPPPSPRLSATILVGAALLFAGLEFLGCDQTPPIDIRFDSSVGADWAPPAAPDAGLATASAADATTTP
jgi:hypothetical protein